MNILFMCVANSARSQLAEGIAKNVFGDKMRIASAGSRPTKVNPLAIAALKEIGVDISQNYSKTTEQLPSQFLANLDYVITLCAEEVCPVILSKAKKLHWPFSDPANCSDLSTEEQLNVFRKTRDAIKERLIEFKRDLENES